VKRFFFDYQDKESSLLDYQGHEFKSPKGAIEFAKTVAEDLTHSLTGNWRGWSVVVRNAEGHMLSAIPVTTVDIAA
jgi:hypothetical protein